jgi:hypothetical protein
MKKSIYSVIAGVVVLSAFAAFAESMTGVVFQQDKYWRIGRDGGNGQYVASAVIPFDEAAKIAPFLGKTVKVTGDLEPSSTFPKFKPGFTVEEVTE